MRRRVAVLKLVVMTGLIACGAAVLVALGVGFAWRRGSGRMRSVGVPGSPAARSAGGAPWQPVTADELGQPLGVRATLLQFSTAVCAPCRATHRLLAEVADMTDGVMHVEVDAESRLDLVRRLDVRKTPTVFVLGPDGEVARRAAGQPRKADVIAALGEVTPGPAT
jgi:thiol-disulfide isomerase/thioredoxin